MLSTENASLPDVIEILQKTRRRWPRGSCLKCESRRFYSHTNRCSGHFLVRLLGQTSRPGPMKDIDEYSRVSWAIEACFGDFASQLDDQVKDRDLIATKLWSTLSSSSQLSSAQEFHESMLLASAIHMRSSLERENTYSLSSHMMTVARMTYKFSPLRACRRDTTSGIQSSSTNQSHDVKQL